MPNFHLAAHCIKYLITARHKRGYGIHSPFLFDLITKGLSQKNRNFILQDVEKLYENLKKNCAEINVTDLGAGSHKMKNNNRKICEIAKYSVMPKKYRLLITKVFKHLKIDTALELGTSLGVTTAYMAKSVKNTVTSIEGDPNLFKLATENLKQLNIKNVKLINAEFTSALEKINQKFDAILIDGNHTYEATMQYFEKLTSNNCHDKTILIFDDIYWSIGMTRSWKEIKKSSKTTLTLDFCKLGIVFLNTGLSKQNFVIRY